MHTFRLGALAVTLVTCAFGCNELLGIESSKVVSADANEPCTSDCESPCSVSGGCPTDSPCDGDTCDGHDADAGSSAAEADVNAPVGPPAQGPVGGDSVQTISGIHLELSPQSHDFGAVVRGQPSEELRFEVLNDGPVVTPALTVEITGRGAPMFSAVQNACSGQLLTVNARCAIVIRFTPTELGHQDALLRIGGELAAVSLHGEGIAPGALVAEPSTGAFADVTLGGNSAPSQVLFHIRNVGQASTERLSSALVGTDAADFVIGADDCSGQSLAGNAECSIAVRFMPNLREGTRSASLVVQGMPGHELSIKLVGRARATSWFYPSDVALDLGVSELGSTGDVIPLVLTNKGISAAIPSIVLEGDPQVLVDDRCSNHLIQIGATCTITFALKPVTTGKHSVRVLVNEGAFVNAVTVTGFGVITHVLDISLAGAASGSVVGPGLTCPNTCAVGYASVDGSPTVTLTAKYDSATTVVSWSAPCSAATASCDIVMDRDQTVTVTFTPRHP